MAANIETLETVREWAETEFPDIFRRFNNFSGGNKSWKLRVEGRIVRGQRVEEQMLMTVLRVSDSLGSPREVLAWAESDGTVSLGHLELESNGHFYMAKHNDCTDPPTRFGKPYCWISPAEDETGAERFEALVRYYICIKGKDASGIRVRKTAFKEHFIGACRDVVAGIQARARGKGDGKGSSDQCIRLKLSPARLQKLEEGPSVSTIPAPAQTVSSAPVEPTILSEASQVQAPLAGEAPSHLAAAPIQNFTVMDRAFASFKDTLTAQILAAQATDRDTIEELHAQNKTLEQRAVTAEKDCEKFKADVAAAEGKARVAEEKARKTDYDELKRVLEGALAKLA